MKRQAGYPAKQIHIPKRGRYYLRRLLLPFHVYSYSPVGAEEEGEGILSLTSPDLLRSRFRWMQPSRFLTGINVSALR